jgi:DNA invertase Pin-like site-specific DNA recombinase
MAVKAAQYVRMSTDQQPGSIEIQKAAITEYAAAHGYEIVATYADEGKSGLTLDERDGMKGLLYDVMRPSCLFTKLLVLDVSRWGRFQDVDESAYWEYHCRRNGVEVVYVAEPFPSATTPLESLIKQLKRVMAAEYSRELGLKIRAGQERSLRLGFVATGGRFLGYQRLAVSASGEPKRILQRGERKPLLTDKVRWVPGSAEDVELVRKIFDIYTTTGIRTWELADQLNAAGKRNSSGEPFTGGGIRKLLSCELYVGNYIFRKTGRKKGQSKIPVSDRASIRIEGYVEPIVDVAVWEKAARKLAYPELTPPRQTKDGLIRSLRNVLNKHPLLPGWAFEAAGLPSRGVYRRNFGSFAAANMAAGRIWTNEQWLERRLSGQRIIRNVLRDIVELLNHCGISCQCNKRKCDLTISSVTVRLKLAHPVIAGDQCGWEWGKWNWREGWLLLMRQNADGTGRDFHLIPPLLRAFVPQRIPPEGMKQFAEFQITDAAALVDRLASFAAKRPRDIGRRSTRFR